MNTGRIIFSQLMDVIPVYQFRKIVARHQGDYRVRRFQCWEQFLCLCFGQLTFRESLRDLSSTLNALDSRRYHMGIKHSVSLSTFADANAARPWQIYQDLAMLLVDQACRVCTKEDEMASTKISIYALDSTTIDLCLSLFPWARFRKEKAAIKLHTLMDLEGSIPTFIHISDGLTHDIHVLDMIPIMAGSIYIMDRGYMDFERLYALDQSGGQFVIRARKNLQYYRKRSTSVDRSSGLQCDQLIRLTGPKPKKKYPKPLRRVRRIDRETSQEIVLLTNMRESVSAETICAYNKSRWQIELFFKWIKQHLRIKAFYGHSPNAVKTQIWTAICTYLIILITQRTNQFTVKLHTMMQVLSVAILDRMTLKQLFSDESLTELEPHTRNQLGLFDI
ncbi:MAG: IS4 family transposase [Balneolaceae bacterium]